MKRALLIFLVSFTFSIAYAKTKMSVLDPSINASAVVTFIPGQLNITLTITNTGDEMLTDIQWFAPDSITFTTNTIPFLAVGETVSIEGTRPFSACIYSGNLFIFAMTLEHMPIKPVPVDMYYAVPTSAAPQITSVITANCTQVPVTGNMQITLSGLPSGNWTLHGNNTSNYSYSGVGSTVVLNINASTIGSGMNFYYDSPNGCPSLLSQLVTSNQLHNFDSQAPMLGTYVDANTDGITNSGDEIRYQIMITNTRACPLEDVRINGFSPSYTNPNLQFSGNPNVAVDVSGYTTLAVPATYIITPQDIINGYVTNATSVNPHWSDALGGSSSTYYPSATVQLNLLSTAEVSFQNFTSYPNPVENVWHIANGLPIEKIEIMTMLGQYLRTIIVNDLSTSIDLSSLSSGSYIARISASHQVKAVKIIKS